MILAVAHLDVMVWGAVGALFAGVITLVLPAGIALMKGHVPSGITGWKVLGFLIVTAVYLLAGALAATKIGHADNGNDGFFYGMAWETLVAGVMKTGKVAAAHPSPAAR